MPPVTANIGPPASLPDATAGDRLNYSAGWKALDWYGPLCRNAIRFPFDRRNPSLRACLHQVLELGLSGHPQQQRYNAYNGIECLPLIPIDTIQRFQVLQLRERIHAGTGHFNRNATDVGTLGNIVAGLGGNQDNFKAVLG